MSCITLLSDLGVQDASLASAKGILMQHLPNTPIIDISNTIEPFHTQQAAYLLVAAYGHFNPNTVHIILFDIFASKTPRLVLTKRQDQYILAPDNGILPLAFGEELETIVTAPQTSEDTSTIYGAEITATHSFSYLDSWLSGFGIKLSYNYADSNFEFEDENFGSSTVIDPNTGDLISRTGIVAPANLFGFSEHVISTQLYYQ